jgi:hypothetical protein
MVSSQTKLENELVLSASQTEELMNYTLQGNGHLQPLNNISNMPNNVISKIKLAPVQSGIETSIVNDNNSMANLTPGQSGTAGRWFSPGTPASSITKTGRHDITEIC